MPRKDGTGPLGMGPCGKHGCQCRKRTLDDQNRRDDQEESLLRAPEHPEWS